MLVDRFGRIHNNLRISVTDRCNIRCFYCMPAENVEFKPREELLLYEEIVRFVQAAVALGIDKLRLTGGEPLVRQDLPALVGQLVKLPGIRDVALTTNGILLSDQAAALRAAGLHRLNISLDTLTEATFQRISRRAGLDRVLEGIFVAKEVGFKKIRLNAVSIRGITEAEIVPLATFARQHAMELRFIEYMPLDAEHRWDHSQVLSGDEVRGVIDREVGPLEALPVADPSQPATDYRYVDGGGRVGFINPVTHPFCSDCNRLRLTAEGQVRNCLFSMTEWDARAILRNTQLPAAEAAAALAELMTACIAAKKPGHGIDTPEFVRPERAMYQIGG